MTRTLRFVPPEWRELLEAIVFGIPALSGALCRGLPEQFDAPRADEELDERRERVVLCLHACRLCPCLRECRAWRDSLPADQQPIGVCAGVLRRSYATRDDAHSGEARS
jgi:hypothetical protein